MTIEITMPKLGLTMKSGIVDIINVKIGDFVNKGDEMITIETDKITSVIEAPDEGYIIDINAKEGEEYNVSEVLCVLSDDKDAVNTNSIRVKEADEIGNSQSEVMIVTAEDVKQNDTDRIFITPAARIIAKQNDIDITTLKRNHNKDRIVKKDVEEAMKSRQIKTQAKQQYRKSDFASNRRAEAIDVHGFVKIVAEKE